MNLFTVIGTITSPFMSTKTEGCFEFTLEEDDDYKKTYEHKFVIWDKSLPKFKSLEGHMCAVKGIVRPYKLGNYINESLIVKSIEVLDVKRTENDTRTAYKQNYRKPQQPKDQPQVSAIENGELKKDAPSDVDVADEDLPF